MMDEKTKTINKDNSIIKWTRIIYMPAIAAVATSLYEITTGISYKSNPFLGFIMTLLLFGTGAIMVFQFPNVFLVKQKNKKLVVALTAVIALIVLIDAINLISFYGSILINGYSLSLLSFKTLAFDLIRVVTMIVLAAYGRLIWKFPKIDEEKISAHLEISKKLLLKIGFIVIVIMIFVSIFRVFNLAGDTGRLTDVGPTLVVFRNIVYLASLGLLFPYIFLNKKWNDKGRILYFACLILQTLHFFISQVTGLLSLGYIIPRRVFSFIWEYTLPSLLIIFVYVGYYIVLVWVLKGIREISDEEDEREV
jgi:hypothetical protein